LQTGQAPSETVDPARNLCVRHDITNDSINAEHKDQDGSTYNMVLPSIAETDWCFFTDDGGTYLPCIHGI